MKAVMVNQPGDVSALVHVDLPDPEPQDHEVVLEVHSCGVCFHDVLTRNGTLKAGVRLPCVLGHEVAGTVVALGSHARDTAPARPAGPHVVPHAQPMVWRPLRASRVTFSPTAVVAP
jgi:NADPH:quinone reductase-like Zn-dependent oxidoreductase